MNVTFTFTLAGVCLIVIAACGLVLTGYFAGWLRARSAFRPEELASDTFWGPEADSVSWSPEASATAVFPVMQEAPTMQVPTITEMPAPDTVRFARRRPERMSDREWLEQASLADLVNGTVRGRVVSNAPKDSMLCPVTVTSPQPALSDDTAAFLADMRTRTDQLIATFREVPAVERAPSLV